MFDIAFSEIVVIAVVALIVIGPERLPKVARTLGHMFGPLPRYVNEVTADINRAMELDELRKLKSEVQAAAERVRILDQQGRAGGRLRRALVWYWVDRFVKNAIRDCVGCGSRHCRDVRIARRASHRRRGNAETNRTAGIRPDLIFRVRPRAGMPPPAALQWPARVCAWFASR
jgi:Tat protein translocase TatB subunit